MGNLTRAQMEADVKFRVGSMTNIDTQITTVVQMSYDELVTSIRIPETQETAVMTTVQGTSIYALPSDFYAIEDIRNSTDGERLAFLTTRNYDAIRDTVSQQKPTHYLWWRNELILHPVPDATTRTILLRYRKRLPALSTSGAFSALPREWDEVVEQGALFRLYRWLGQKAESQMEFAEYTAMIQRRLDRISESAFDRQDSAAPLLIDRVPRGFSTGSGV